ncbi:hypothetical protein ACFLV3_07330 [Chloroflexota bacterium]
MTKLSGSICLAVVLLLLVTMFGGTTALAIVPNGIPSGGRLFVVDGDESSQILELDPSTGAVLNSFPTPVPTNDGPEGLAYCNGRMFFVSSPEEGPSNIYEINPETGAVINSFPAPPGLDALGLSPDRLFALDFVANTILVLNPNDGAPITSYTQLPELLGGGTFAGTRDSLFFTGPPPDTIYELDPSNGAVLNSFPFPESAIDVYGLGFSASRNTLFLGTYDGIDTIYEVNPNNGDVINSFPNPEGVHISAMAADECDESPPQPVGGELFPVNKINIIAPFFALALLLVIGGGVLVWRQRLAQ